MKELIVTGKNVEEATQKALATLGVTILDVDVEVLAREKRGIMGIGAQDAEVRVIVKETPASKGEDYIRALFAEMGIGQYDINLTADDQTITYDITSEEDIGFVIGYHGDVLDALSAVVSMAVNKGSDIHYRVTVDVNSYRSKRIESLKDYAANAIRKAQESEFVTVANPMKPYERLVLHTAVQETIDVVSWSEGEEPRRRVIIAPLTKVRKVGDHYERTDRSARGDDFRRSSGNHRDGGRSRGGDRRGGRNTPRPKYNAKPQPVGEPREKRSDFSGSLYGKIEINKD